MAKKKTGEIIEYDALTVKNKIIQDMKSLGTYKEEYMPLINIYADLLQQYQMTQQQFIQSGYQLETSTAAGGTKKSAIVGALENIRKDIVLYSDRLCLNPKTIENITVEDKKQSKLASVLSKLE